MQLPAVGKAAKPRESAGLWGEPSLPHSMHRVLRGLLAHWPGAI